MVQCNKQHVKTQCRNKYLKILFQNIQYLSNKKEQVEILLEECGPDILILAEHGLNQSCLELSVPKNYFLKDMYCRQSCKGGGVSIYVINKLLNLSQKVPWIADYNVEKVVEYVGLEIEEPKKTLIIGVYRIPKSNNLADFYKSFTALLDKAQNHFMNFLIMGDFNIRFCRMDNGAKTLLNITNSFGLERRIFTDTRISLSSKTCIDNAFTNMTSCTAETITTGISDHEGIVAIIKHKFNSDSLGTLHTFRKINNKTISCLNKDLENEKWLDVFESKDTNDKYEIFINKFTSYFNRHCPNVQKMSRQRNMKHHWYSDELKKEKENIKIALHNFKSTKNTTSWENYKKLKKTYEKNIKIAKNAYTINKIVCSNFDSKTIWKVINGETKQNPSSQVIRLKENDKVIEDSHLIANTFNTYYSNICNSFPVSHKGKPQSQSLQRSDRDNSLTIDSDNLFLEFVPITTNEVVDVSKTFKPKKSSGYDEVPMTIIKNCINYIKDPITHIINFSLKNGIVPNSMKISKVVPIFKKGDIHNKENYRPVALLSNFSKFLEKIVHIQTLKFLEDNTKLNKCQFGFLPNKSTKHALIHFVENTVISLDSGKKAMACFLDLSRAFDLVSKETLLHKLEDLGIKGKCLSWFDNYMSYRRQFVEIKQNKMNDASKQSNVVEINRGVPQGSILGPLLFVIYLNDITKTIPTHNLTIYADDTTLLNYKSTSEELEVNTFTLLNSTAQYFNMIGLYINQKKTEFINFKTNHRTVIKDNPNMFLDDCLLKEVLHTNFLGVTIDSFFNWNEHINNLTSKLSTSLYIIRKISKLNYKPLALQCYYSYFYSHVAYSIILWGSSSLKNLQKIFVLQKRALKYIEHKNKRESCKHIFKSNKILTVPSLYIYETITYVIFQNLLIQNSSHHYNTKIKFISSQQHSSKIFEKIPVYMGRKLFNKLPNEIQDFAFEDKNLFKKKLKSWLIEKCCYDLNI